MSPPITLQLASTAGLESVRETTTSFESISLSIRARRQTVRGVRVGFEEPHLRLLVQIVEPEFSRISHVSAYAINQGRLVLRYGVEKPVVVRS